MADNYALHGHSSLKATPCQESSVFAVTFLDYELQEPKLSVYKMKGPWKRSKFQENLELGNRDLKLPLPV
ncbi:hypothetical protein MTR67_029712 [Solanum verrucosum]|uniref:Uncharacterized protein n=1 Tax=Solanum verrucosum TaxID=315347 RepID=A0AAF0R4T8_SOLVR|nr:hypothetical protein MTR67_029712 [Solanum verrucosum]